MAVRAKFQCQRIDTTKYAGYQVKKVVFTPVTPQNSTGKPEDKDFWQSTPSGEISMSIDNDAAANQFEPGKKYYVDFSPADQ